MVVYRSHLKDPLSMGQLKVRYLYHYRSNLYNIDYGHYRQKKRQMEHICRSRHITAQRQGSGIAHKHLGLIGIKEQEAQKAAEYRSRYHRYRRCCLSSQYGRSNHKEQCYSRSNRRRKSVQTVCKIRARIGSKYGKKQYRQPQYPGIQFLFGKWHYHIKIDILIPDQKPRKKCRNDKLQRKLLPCRQPLRTLKHDLDKIIYKAYKPKRHYQYHHR